MKKKNLEADVTLNPAGYYELRSEYRKNMDSFYKDEYYQDNHALYKNEYEASELEYKNNLYLQKDYLVKSMLGKCPDTKPGFLDIGCGEGYALAWFDQNGWDVVGIDESAYGVSAHNPSMTDKLVQGDFYNEKIRLADRHYDFINADNVLEHVPDPLEFMKTVVSLCDKSTVICITVPNDFSLMQYLAYEMGQIDSAFWVTKDTSEHFNYFGLESLKNLGDMAGLQMITALSDFPIDLFLLHTETNYRKKQTGHECHVAGIRLENRLFSASVENVVKLHQALALNGIGRDISVYFKMK